MLVVGFGMGIGKELEVVFDYLLDCMFFVCMFVVFDVDVFNFFVKMLVMFMCFM